jgi:hypothetical protein
MLRLPTQHPTQLPTLPPTQPLMPQTLVRAR